MKMKCELSAEEVYKILGEELTKRGLKWSELNASIQPSMIFDMADVFNGITFQLEVAPKA